MVNRDAWVRVGLGFVAPLLLVLPLAAEQSVAQQFAVAKIDENGNEAERRPLTTGTGYEIRLHERDEASSKPLGTTTRVITDEQTRFTGEHISITLEDAEIKDVLRVFAALTGLNIVVDPRVSGTVSLELRDVPWDQVIDLILRMNGYTYTIGERVIIVHPAGSPPTP